MNGKQYLKNKLPMLVLNLVCMMALSAFLLLSGNSVDSISLILFVWLLVLAGSQALAYNSRKKQMEKLLRLTEQLDEQYLIAELMSLPEQADDQVFYQILKLAEKSMLERIGTIQRERLEYKEYIEQWIHEVKTPITAMKLLCENNRSAFTRELLAELEKTNRFIDQALYYARSEHTEKDYLVREIRLFDAVHGALQDAPVPCHHHRARCRFHAQKARERAACRARTCIFPRRTIVSKLHGVCRGALLLCVACGNGACIYAARR